MPGRGFLSDKNVEELRSKRAAEPHARLWKRLTERTQEIMGAVRESGFTLDMGGIGWHSRTPSVQAAALMHLLDDDAEALRYVEECVRMLIRDSEEKMSGEVAPPAGKGGPRLLVHSLGEVASATDMLRDRLGEETRSALLCFMREIAIDYGLGAEPYVMYGGGGNIVWCRNVRSAVCALLWGEDCEHPTWREVVRHGVNHTRCYLKYGCDEAGYSFEGTGYGHGVFRVMFEFVELLRLTGWADLYQTEPKLRAIIESTLHSLFPDQRFLTNDNDVGLGGAESMPYLLPAWRRYGDPLYLGFWQAYQGPDHPIRPYGDYRLWTRELLGHERPALDQLHTLFMSFLYWDAEAPLMPVEQAQRPTARVGWGSARADVRTSWGRDAVYLNVLGAGRSRMSQTHRHADAGHFSLFAHGEYLAIDTGRYNSDEDQHNVVLVDGQCRRPLAPGWGMDAFSGSLTEFQHGPLVSCVQVDTAHEKDCYWALRTFLFVPYGTDSAYIVVLDNVNKDNQKHSYWWQLQVNTECTIEEEEVRATVRGQRARLDIRFIIPEPDTFPDDPHTLSLRQDTKEWHWPYGRQQDTTDMEKQGLLVTSVRRPRLIAELTGLNGTMMALVSPRRGSEAPLEVTVPRQRRLMQAKIDVGGPIDHVVAALDHGFIETDEVRALSELVLVRRDRSGRVLATWSIDGAPVEVR